MGSRRSRLVCQRLIQVTTKPSWLLKMQATLTPYANTAFGQQEAQLSEIQDALCASQAQDGVLTSWTLPVVLSRCSASSLALQIHTRLSMVSPLSAAYLVTSQAWTCGHLQANVRHHMQGWLCSLSSWLEPQSWRWERRTQ